MSENSKGGWHTFLLLYFIIGFVSYREIQYVLHFLFWLFPEAIDFSFPLDLEAATFLRLTVISVCPNVHRDILAYTHNAEILGRFSHIRYSDFCCFYNRFWRNSPKFKKMFEASWLEGMARNALCNTGKQSKKNARSSSWTHVNLQQWEHFNSESEWQRQKMQTWLHHWWTGWPRIRKPVRHTNMNCGKSHPQWIYNPLSVLPKEPKGQRETMDSLAVTVFQTKVMSFPKTCVNPYFKQKNVPDWWGVWNRKRMLSRGVLEASHCQAYTCDRVLLTLLRICHFSYL